MSAQWLPICHFIHPNLAMQNSIYSELITSTQSSQAHHVPAPFLKLYLTHHMPFFHISIFQDWTLTFTPVNKPLWTIYKLC